MNALTLSGHGKFCVFALKQVNWIIITLPIQREDYQQFSYPPRSCEYSRTSTIRSALGDCTYSDVLGGIDIGVVEIGGVSLDATLPKTAGVALSELLTLDRAQSPLRHERAIETV